MPNIGTSGIILVVLIALLLFGPSKLPELGRAFGRTLREFKSGAKDMLQENQPEKMVQAQPQLLAQSQSQTLREEKKEVD